MELSENLFIPDVYTERLIMFLPTYAVYTTDFRLLFVLTAIYTSLVTHFRQAGNQETEQDIVSGRLFKVNSIWTNHSVSGGVSDRILWNCRSDSQTVTYYKSLYLG